MKKQEHINKSDIEKKSQKLQGRYTQRGKQSGSLKPEDYFQEINTESSPESSISILASPGLSHPVNASRKENMISYFQQMYGNKQVNRMIQTKLKVSQPNDEYEQEADRMADKVLGMPKTPIQEQIGEEEEIVQAKKIPGKTPEISNGLESRTQSLSSRGQPLPKSLRNFFEPRFEQDFSNVRVHNNPDASELSRSLKAKALTVGKDILFGHGQYSPETPLGKKLLAHELTHIVQQKSEFGHIPVDIFRKEEKWDQILRGNLHVKCINVNKYWDEILPDRLSKWLSAKGIRVYSWGYPTVKAIADYISGCIDEIQEKVKWNYWYEYELTVKLSSIRDANVTIKFKEYSPAPGEPRHHPPPPPARTTEMEITKELETKEKLKELKGVGFTPEAVKKGIEISSDIYSKTKKFLEAWKFTLSEAKQKALVSRIDKVLEDLKPLEKLDIVEYADAINEGAKLLVDIKNTEEGSIDGLLTVMGRIVRFGGALAKAVIPIIGEKLQSDANECAKYISNFKKSIRKAVEYRWEKKEEYRKYMQRPQYYSE